MIGESDPDFLIIESKGMSENCRRIKRVENAVGKGEIARYERFLLFPLCFQKTCTADM